MGWPADHVFSIVVTVVISLLSTLANLTLITVFLLKHQLWTTSNYFIIGLITADLLLGLLYPLQTLAHFKILTSNPGCIISTCVLLMLGLIALYSLFSLTIERYIFISRPLKADSIVTFQRYIIVTSVATIYAGIVAFLPAVTPIGYRTPGYIPEGCRFHTLVPSGAYRFFFFANRFLPLPVMIVLYVKIFLLVRRHARAVAAQMQTQTSPSRVSSVTHGTSFNNVCDAIRRKYKFKTEAKSALLLFIIVAYFVITFIPFTIILFQQNVSPETNQMIYAVANMFAFSNCVVNPLIYGVGNRAFRNAIKGTFFSRFAFGRLDQDFTFESRSHAGSVEPRSAVVEFAGRSPTS